MPFLFKVLSAGKALSIQAHPDKSLAEKLHTDNPGAYGDDNHKPEMAIALTPFEAMCGFRRIGEITILLKRHPEFAACIDEVAQLRIFVAQTEEQQRDALRGLFSSFMSCPAEQSKKHLANLLKRLQGEQFDHPHPHEEPPWERKCSRAILRLAQQFPSDVGAMSPLFLNYLLIAPGEAFFMAANEPHAYVAGEIIECMACSDNVVRAGLTPKFKDVPNLVSMLTYSMGGPSIDAGAPAYGDDRIMRYTPPVPEFEVMVITCNPGETLTMPRLKVPAVFIVIAGCGSTDNEIGQRLVMRPGRTYYLPPDCPPLTLTVNVAKRGPLRIAMAHENLHMDRPTVVVSIIFSSPILPPLLFLSLSWDIPPLDRRPSFVLTLILPKLALLPYPQFPTIHSTLHTPLQTLARVQSQKDEFGKWAGSIPSSPARQKERFNSIAAKD